MTAAGLITGALLAAALLGWELDRALSQRPEGTRSRPPVEVLWLLGIAFSLLLTIQLFDYL